MRISDFDYNLPEERIAHFPPKIRGQTRLLTISKNGDLGDKRYSDLADYLEAGDVVVLNNTKVIKARLLAVNSKNQPRELLLIEEHGNSSAFTRKAIYRGSLKGGETVTVGQTPININKVLDGGLVEVSSNTNLLDLAEQYGTVPLPPYMKRQANKSDIERYQTVFAKQAGSVAAPTASLNFTQKLVDELTTKGVKIVYLTLHVGLGTFLPIRTDQVEEHTMHSEYFEIPKNTVVTIKQAKQNGKNVLAVGTTVARTLEFAHAKILDGPETDISGEANIFIYPGYKFKIVDKLVTNFHAPRSTVLMLTAAFAGWNNLKNAYDHAVEHKYNFLSYGDSTLIE
ncbi:MAG: tRNA preQ1(34) S-adenosylmethionine ribosyltransferase-isomerase QueA [Candidatus Saccharimonadales bacterium]